MLHWSTIYAEFEACVKEALSKKHRVYLSFPASIASIDDDGGKVKSIERAMNEPGVRWIPSLVLDAVVYIHERQGLVEATAKAFDQANILKSIIIRLILGEQTEARDMEVRAALSANHDFIAIDDLAWAR